MAEKIIHIGKQKVRFVVTGATPLMYMAMYGKDFLSEFLKLEKDLQHNTVKDFMPFYQISYCLAKKGNPEIPELMEWLESFEDGFPVFELVDQLMPLIQVNFATNLKQPPTVKKKQKKKN